MLNFFRLPSLVWLFSITWKVFRIPFRFHRPLVIHMAQVSVNGPRVGRHGREAEGTDFLDQITAASLPFFQHEEHERLE